MRPQIKYVVLFVVAIIAATIYLIVKLQTIQPASPQKTETVSEKTSIPEPVAPQSVTPATESTALNDAQSSISIRNEKDVSALEQDPRFNDPVFKEQVGRVALGLVGHNPQATEVWIQIINDPSLSDDARSNLIEDLNEDGLDFRNLTLNDLPVILYRINLIEGLAPDAMDEVNAEAFKEAHKDLVNMAARLTGQ